MPNSPLRIPVWRIPALFSLRSSIFTFSYFLPLKHWNIYSFNLIQLWAPHCICELARQGAPCKLCTQKQLPPWAQGGKVGSSTASSSQSHLQGAHAAGAAPLGHRVCYRLPHTSEHTHPCRGCVGTAFMPMIVSAPPPHYPWKLWGLLNTVELLSKSVQF